MAQDKAPNAPRNNIPFVDPQTGMLSDSGLEVMQQIWRQIAAGFVVVPCSASGQNAITLTPLLHSEGGLTLGDGMIFGFEAVQTSNAAVTVQLAELGFIKGYKTNGAAQAGTGDVVDGSYYLASYLSSLDSGAGGFVLK